MGFDGIGVLTGARSSFLDHLIPLCQLMDIPLFCSDPWIAELAEIYYPVQGVTSQFPLFAKTLFYVEPSKLPHGSFDFTTFVHPGKNRSVCGLHGNSDKNSDTFWIERLADEDIVLIYGQYLFDVLKEKGMLSRIPFLVRTGNYRYAFYQKHKSFFDRLVKPFLFTTTQKITVLYAPTWCYSDKKNRWNSSFFEVYPKLLDSIPEEFQIIVKLHPFFFYLYKDKVEEIQNQYSEKENVLFLDEMPLVYPLLEKVDIYLGDYSSVGYDFLTYNKPLFFLNPGEKKHYLSTCGKALHFDDYKKIYQILASDTQKSLHSRRNEAYEYVYGEPIPFETLHRNIKEALE